MVDVHSDRRAHPLSDDPSRYSCRTTKGCRLYWLSLLVCRFGLSGSSGFAGGFLRLRWSGCVPVPGVRSCPDRCRYRYTCRPVGFPVRGGCRPKRIRFPFRGRLKLLRFSDGLCLSFCPRHRSCTPKFLSCRLF